MSVNVFTINNRRGFLYNRSCPRSITGGDTDIFEFEYDSTTAVASNKLLFKTEPDYESLKDRNYTYSVQVGLNDGSSQEYGTFSVRVTDENDAPVITIPSINIDQSVTVDAIYMSGN